MVAVTANRADDRRYTINWRVVTSQAKRVKLALAFAEFTLGTDYVKAIRKEYPNAGKSKGESTNFELLEKILKDLPAPSERRLGQELGIMRYIEDGRIAKIFDEPPAIHAGDVVISTELQGIFRVTQIMGSIFHRIYRAKPIFGLKGQTYHYDTYTLRPQYLQRYPYQFPDDDEEILPPSEEPLYKVKVPQLFIKNAQVRKWASQNNIQLRKLAPQPGTDTYIAETNDIRPMILADAKIIWQTWVGESLRVSFSIEGAMLEDKPYEVQIKQFKGWMRASSLVRPLDDRFANEETAVARAQEYCGDEDVYRVVRYENEDTFDVVVVIHDNTVWRTQ